ncbi:MAG: glycoside hydrolase family 16 protein, partial [Gammaproteobacteria bacterium]|nr:glycoside hydrolase family 16 protein [Gammaproteobacteria bacterium]
MHFNRLAQRLRIPAIALFSIILASCGSGDGEDPVNASGSDIAVGELRVIFRDDFGGPASVSPRTAGKLSAQPLPLDNWVVETGYGDNGWGNDEWQLYQNSIGNLFIENNSLVIRARCVNAPACGKRDGSITSARINTKDRLNVRNGNIKARIKMPSGAGMWPAFWTLGADIDERPWPDAGEIDIVEMHYFFSDTRTTHFSTHWSGPRYTPGTEPDCRSDTPSLLDPDNEEENCNTTNKEFDEPLTDDFHIFELDWSDNQIVGKIDGITYFTQAIDPVTMEEFLKDHFLILNVAVGGTLGGQTGPAMSAADWADPDQTDMLVDWVEVSERVPPSTGYLIDESGNNLPYNRIINTAEFGAGFVDSDLDSSAVPPLVGNTVLELNFSNTGSPNGGGVPAAFSGAVFDFNSIDLSNFTKLVFSIDVSQFDDLAFLGIELQDNRFDGIENFQGQVVRDLFSYTPVAESGFWRTYEIPLSDFVGINLDAVNAFIFGNPRDALPDSNLLSGTLYLDDIRFVIEPCTDPALVSFGAAGYRPTDFSGSVVVSNACAPSSLAKVMLVTGEEEVVVGVDLDAAGEGSASFDICPATNDEDSDIAVTDGVILEAFYADSLGNILSSTQADIDSTITGPPAPVFFVDLEPGSGGGSGTFSNFGGGESQVIDNPVMTGDNSSSRVARMWKFADQPFGGTALINNNPIPLAASDQIFTMKVWSSRAVAVTFKLEFPTPPGGIPDGSGVSNIVTTSGIEGWETLTFDFSGDDLSTVVDNKIVLIFDDGTVGNANDDVLNGTTEWTFYFDDITLGKGDGPNPNCTSPPAVVDGGTGLGVFSETNIGSTVTVNDIVSAGNTVVIDANSTAVTPFDGSVVLSLEYQACGAGFGGAVIEFDDADLTAYNTLKFSIDTSQFTDFANLTLQLEPPGGGTAGGNVALAAYMPVATSGDWSTYEIPLDDFTAVDLSLVNRLGFFNARDGGDVLLAGTLYLDDIHFVFVQRALPCDGSSPCGVYSETNTISAVSINDIVSAGNTVVIDANSTAVTPFDGSFVLSLDYQAGTNGFGGAIFVFDAVDITVYDTLKFTIDTSAVTDFANLTVQLEPPPGGTAGGNVLLGGYTPVATSGNWNTYEIPLADFTAVTGTAVTALGFFNLADSAGLTTGTIYLDDIHFLTVGGGTGGGCDGSSPCGVFSETNTTSTVNVTGTTGDAGNLVVIDP